MSKSNIANQIRIVAACLDEARRKHHTNKKKLNDADIIYAASHLFIPTDSIYYFDEPIPADNSPEQRKHYQDVHLQLEVYISAAEIQLQEKRLNRLQGPTFTGCPESNYSSSDTDTDSSDDDENKETTPYESGLYRHEPETQPEPVVRQNRPKTPPPSQTTAKPARRETLKKLCNLQRTRDTCWLCMTEGHWASQCTLYPHQTWGRDQCEICEGFHPCTCLAHRRGETFQPIFGTFRRKTANKQGALNRGYTAVTGAPPVPRIRTNELQQEQKSRPRDARGRQQPEALDLVKYKDDGPLEPFILQEQVHKSIAEDTYGRATMSTGPPYRQAPEVKPTPEKPARGYECHGVNWKGPPYQHLTQLRRDYFEKKLGSHLIQIPAGNPRPRENTTTETTKPAYYYSSGTLTASDFINNQGYIPSVPIVQQPQSNQQPEVRAFNLITDIKVLGDEHRKITSYRAAQYKHAAVQQLLDRFGASIIPPDADDYTKDGIRHKWAGEYEPEIKINTKGNDNDFYQRTFIKDKLKDLTNFVNRYDPDIKIVIIWSLVILLLTTLLIRF
jgi:hypothetical protein